MQILKKRLEIQFIEIINFTENFPKFEYLGTEMQEEDGQGGN